MIAYMFNHNTPDVDDKCAEAMVSILENTFPEYVKGENVKLEEGELDEGGLDKITTLFLTPLL